ncbi:TPA: DUF3265 domain-containing protein [Vibrio parahaemolyticus]|nr:DUF3265 domain-containing protein [Vibrio parahaemolyticus]HCG9630878.1 DUF3265 domain-containing protein [Vibrio parahaemolyticus]HCH3558128.1 DUF3265 domain-containing protein [Vibrio parahaemolyticus]
MDNLDNSSNKLFKSDSQRVAFLLCVGFGVLGGMRELRYSVAHTLTGRYVLHIQYTYAICGYSTF